MKCFITDPPQEGKFVAFYSDGSGAGLFAVTEDGMIDSDGDIHHLDDLQESYTSWLPVDDNYPYWFEIQAKEAYPV